MTSPAIDIAMVGLVLGVGLWSLLARDAVPAVIGFIVYGMLVSLAWVRLGAIDVAMTEAAIGGGATGILIMRAALRKGAPAPSESRSPLVPVLAVALCAGVAVVLALLVLEPVVPAPSLAPLALANLPSTDLRNGVTAVLMAYRGIDTLLEKVVLAVGLIAVWSLTPDALWGAQAGQPRAAEPDSVLGLLARVLPPIGILVGIYLVWAGANEPGGAFAGGTIVAAMWVLVILSGLKDPPAMASRALRVCLVAGAGLFIGVGLAGLFFGSSFLAYPDGFAKPLIILIEAAMTLSIAATIGLLVLGPPDREPAP